jgi:hypothetical protein
VDPVLGGKPHRVGDPFEHPLSTHADRVQLEVGDRRLDHRGADTELDQRLEVGRHGAREAPDLGSQPRVGDQPDGVPVVLRDAREAGLDPIDPQVVEQACDLELLLGVEHHADGLLPVSQGRVVEADRAAEPVGVVHLAAPDHPQTTPSGKAESFSAPFAVTRKLSSTRSPPPPSQ